MLAKKAHEITVNLPTIDNRRNDHSHCTEDLRGGVDE
jgi:hypothetical protein